MTGKDGMATCTTIRSSTRSALRTTTSSSRTAAAPAGPTPSSAPGTYFQCVSLISPMKCSRTSLSHIADLMSNLILGAVVENFSYVFQIYGKVQMINREEMRGYKRVWQKFDPERTGFMKKQDIVAFLGVSARTTCCPDMVLTPLSFSISQESSKSRFSARRTSCLLSGRRASSLPTRATRGRSQQRDTTRATRSTTPSSGPLSHRTTSRRFTSGG